jgi:hypothetical protein
VWLAIGLFAYVMFELLAVFFGLVVKCIALSLLLIATMVRVIGYARPAPSHRYLLAWRPAHSTTIKPCDFSVFYDHRRRTRARLCVILYRV